MLGMGRHAYARPPLTKRHGRVAVRRVWRNAEAQRQIPSGYDGHRAGSAARLVRDQRGGKYVYEKLLLATGGSPNRLPFGGDDIIYFRTLQDYLRLRALVDQANTFVVLGGSFIGSEIAAALTIQQKQVTMLFRERSICEASFPPDLSEHLNEYYREKGVGLMPGDSLAAVERQGTRLLARTASGQSIEADAIIAGIGIHPNVDLAQAAGLAVDDGIVVDEHQRTSVPDIFAASDGAFHFALRGARVGMKTTPVKMGKQAGRNLAAPTELHPRSHLLLGSIRSWL
jgi:NADPH-dependent 2,4-dienoyl-CoA reductase/sulfur reductase-like enzyme